MSRPPRDRAALRRAVATAKLSGGPPAVTDRARAALLAWIDAQPDRPLADLARDLSSGRAATQIGHAMLGQTPMPQGLACATGCAFCCILPGEDGGTITAHEARALHDALGDAPRTAHAWHPDACPALDPETRACRAYDARPLICRAYVSPDAAACEAIAEGIPRPGPLTHPAQLLYLTAHALARAALGPGTAPTYALKRAAAARSDADLKAARHPARNLDAERRRLAQAAR